MLCTEEDVQIAKNVIKKCELYGFTVYVLNILDFEKENWISVANSLPHVHSEITQKNNDMFRTSTARNDFISNLRQKAFLKCAEKLNCNYIFTGEASVTLATNLLTGIIVGRGSQLEHNVASIYFN